MEYVKNKYIFKSGSFIKADAQVAGEQCERLAREGRCTAKELVNENRPESAPLHNAFEWRDDVAGELYREYQARHIMNCLLIVKENVEPVRVLLNIERKSPEYKHIDAILESADDTRKMLQTAMNELRWFKRKYGQLKELTDVFKAIDKLETEAAS